MSTPLSIGSTLTETLSTFSDFESLAPLSFFLSSAVNEMLEVRLEFVSFGRPLICLVESELLTFVNFLSPASLDKFCAV